MASLSITDLHHLVQSYIDETLQDAYDARVLRTTPLTEDVLEDERELLEDQLEDRKQRLRECDYRAMKDRIHALLNEHGHAIHESDPAFLRLCHEVLKADIEIIEVELERNDGVFKPRKEVSATHTSSSSSFALDTPPTSLQDVVRSYAIEQMRAGNWSEKSRQENHACYKMFFSYAGEDVTVNKIDHAMMRQYKETLQKLPSNMSKRKAYRGKTVPQLLEMEIPQDHLLSVTSVNKYLNRISTLFDYAVKNGYMTVNPAAAMQLKQTKRDDEFRAAFTPEDLRALFHSKEYAEDTHRQPFHYWTPIIALFTAMRQNEIAQLHLDDIKQTEEDGLWVIDLENAPKDRQLKNSNARRIIPLHPFLVDDLNLPAYADKLRSEGHDRLFPEITKGRDGYGQRVSRWFNDSGRGYRQRCGIDPKDAQKDFHSFRHTLIDHLKQNPSVDVLMLHEFDGHSSQSMTLGRYGKRYTPANLLEHVVSLIDFHKTIPLDHLKASKYAGGKSRT